MSVRKLNFFGFAACSAAMAFALYLQWGRGLDPCPLCVLQRVAMIGTGVFFLLAALHHPARVGQTLYSVGKLLCVLAGLLVAGRHVWLQQLPADQVPSCGPGYDYLMEVFPWHDALAIIFRGSGECAKIDWTWLGITLPQLTLASFIGLFFWVLWTQRCAWRENT